MVSIKNLNFSYSKKGLPLFRDLNLQASGGSIIGLLGKNGAGKSTLLKIIAGLLKSHSGDISVLNYDPIKRYPSFMQQVFFVPEEFEVPSISIDEYVKCTAPLYPTFDFAKMDDIINSFELDRRVKLSKMSYGQKKKFLIAFALATNCNLLALDEPTNGLDIPSKALFRKVMAGALNDEQTVIISTHQVKDVENLIDRILLIDNGNIVFNHDTIDVSESLSFETVSDTTGIDFVYSENVAGGHRVVKQKDKSGTPLDIELLFNAVTNGSKFEIHESDI
ncbi:MAG: ABC transporter ATP-binding protein [Bacteroidota bacterium]